MNDLKPCPFCCGEAFIIKRSSYDGDIIFDIGCTSKDCFIEDGADQFYESEKEAIEAWNKRVVPEGYVKLEDVLEIIKNPDCLFCKQLQIEKNGSINRYYCNENECEAFKIKEIKALGDKSDKE